MALVMMHAGSLRPGKSFEHVDARELWMLAQKYMVDGIQEWLIANCITAENVCAAAQFACDFGEGLCDDLLRKCKKKAAIQLPEYSQDSLRGLEFQVADKLLGEYLKRQRACCHKPAFRGFARPKLSKGVNQGCSSPDEQGFKFVERWMEANKSRETSAEEAKTLLSKVDMSGISQEFLQSHVRQSKLLDVEQVWLLLDNVLESAKEYPFTQGLRLWNGGEKRADDDEDEDEDEDEDDEDDEMNGGDDDDDDY
jgi:hypothetical protein